MGNMKKILLLLATLFLVACTPEVLDTTPVDVDDTSGEFSCTTDADCTTSGCSSTVCQHVNVGPTFTTCEWKEEYACYQEANCGCVNNNCAWQDDDLDACIKEKQSLN